MTHLDNSTLNYYLDGALDAPARARADAHLSSCPTCASEIAALRALTASFAARALSFRIRVRQIR